MATRRHRLELPGAPTTSDPEQIKRYLSDIRRLTMDEFNRLSNDFFDFRQDVINSGTIPLASVAAISVTPGIFDASFAWENPVQPQALPTHVRVRIAEFGDTWQEFEYPISSWTAFGLAPNTEYTFQIQLVRRAAGTISFVSALRNCPSIPVQVESLSEIRSRSFQTLPGLGPPQDDDGDVIFPIPDTDDPGPVGGDNCWWEWQIQIVNLTTGEWQDTVHGGSVAGDAGNITFDITILDPLRVYRIKYREVCNGVPGPWIYGEPFTGGSNWLGDCGGNDPSASILEAPFVTADLWAIPYACMIEAVGIRIREYLSGIEVIPNFGFDLIFADAAAEWNLLADIWDNSFTTKPLASTFLPVLENLDNSDDLTLAMELWQIDLPSNPPGGFGNGPVLDVGGGRIVFNVTYTQLGAWGIQAVMQREIGGTMILNSTLTYDSGFLSDPLLVYLVIDQDGDKKLVVNGEIVATDTSGEEIRLDGMSGLFKMFAYSNQFTRKVYGWNRALTDLEIAGAVGEFVASLSGSPLSELVDLTLQGNVIVAVARGDNAIVTIDVSDPENPELMDSIVSSNFDDIRGVAANATHAFGLVPSGSPRLVSFLISDPDDISTLHELIQNPGYTNLHSAVLEGSTLYVSRDTLGGSGALYVFNVSNPGAMTQTGVYSNALIQGATEFVKVGTRIYLCCGDIGKLAVISVATPSAPSLTVRVDAGTECRGIDHHAGYLYVVNTNDSTLQVFSVANPDLPVLVLTMDTVGGGSPTELRVDSANDHLYVLEGYGVSVYDISDPELPVFLAHAANGTTLVGPQALALDIPYVYVAYRQSGTFAVYRFHGV